jgi:hypothetical protein
MPRFTGMILAQYAPSAWAIAPAQSEIPLPRLRDRNGSVRVWLSIVNR